MLEKIEDKLGDHHSGELRRETAEAKAERISKKFGVFVSIMPVQT